MWGRLATAAGHALLMAGAAVVVASCAVTVDGSRGAPAAGLVGPASRPSSRTPTASRPAPRSTEPAPAPTSRADVPAGPGPAANAQAAAAYGRAHGVRAGIAVLDRRTGQLYGGGDYTGLFGSASVMKVLVATRLLATGQMEGETETLATAMIERSDDAAVRTLWPQAGGPGVLPWVADHYRIGGLGSPNSKSEIWGNTHITAAGIVRLYRAVAADPAVGPWLLDAMHHATRIAADGTDQFFGLPSATTGAAVKQGWGALSVDDPDNAIVNTTGYVDGDRYAVAILGEGLGYNATTNPRGYNARLAAVVTHMATLLLPGGHVR